ncbi:MAG: hypothetical protein Q4D85_11335 [Corynebacterium sp.]|uniref:hypothetical protein n=1 Tax=Corynebacterium sp. TaxID=1720 RepID=UPI0026DD96A7|nr:hypothetical protein [Corynebacterium sp.]MDO5099328.1 hypothetical protein [Corynebacterium sp.]
MKALTKTLIAVGLITTLSGCSAPNKGEATRETYSFSTAVTAETEVSVESQPVVSDEEIEIWAKSALGGPENEPWTSVASNGIAPAWAYTVNRVYYSKGGNIVFNVQLDRQADKAVAETIAKLYANQIRYTDNPEWAESASYIIVENGAGEHITQENI